MLTIKKIVSMLTFKEYLIESKKKRPLHLFEDGEMTFGDIRNIVEDIFSKNIVSIVNRKPVATISLTCIDGKVMGTLNGLNPSTPIVSEKLGSEYKGTKAFKEAFNNSIAGIEKKISELGVDEQNEMFDNGRRFINFQLISPASEDSLSKTDNRFLAIPSGTTHYDEKFENETPLTESDTDIAQRMIDLFSVVNNDKTSKASNLDPLARDAYRLTNEEMQAFAKCPNRKEAINEVSKLLMELIDGLGYRATLNDYVKERYERKIMNCATKSGIDLRRSSEFVSEMVDRLSTMSAKRPTMGDLTTYAKREGLDVKSERYKKFLEMIEGTLDTDNYEMLRPISILLNRIVVLFLTSILGYAMMCDVKLANSITVVLDSLESAGEMTEANLTLLKKLFNKLYEFAKTHENGDDFVCCKNDCAYTIKCRFPAIESLGTKILKA